MCLVKEKTRSLKICNGPYIDKANMTILEQLLQFWLWWMVAPLVVKNEQFEHLVVKMNHLNI